jgi:hypothetical protein
MVMNFSWCFNYRKFGQLLRNKIFSINKKWGTKIDKEHGDEFRLIY